jgi:predicted secreted acid phosphatase
MHRRLSLITMLVLICLWAPSAIAQRIPCADHTNCETCNLGLYKNLLNDYEASGQYDRDIKEVVGEAKIYLAEQQARKGKLAIVLDIDETSLSNWPEIKANDFGVFLNLPCSIGKDGSVQVPCGLTAWIGLGKDTAIAPTLDLYAQARRQGIKVFFITGRHASQRGITKHNLNNAGYTGWSDDDLKMEPDDLRPPSAAYFKTVKRKEIVDSGYAILLNMGDQDSDLTGGFAERTFKLPNPFYFIP